MMPVLNIVVAECCIANIEVLRSIDVIRRCGYRYMVMHCVWKIVKVEEKCIRKAINCVQLWVHEQNMCKINGTKEETQLLKRTKNH